MEAGNTSNTPRATTDRLANTVTDNCKGRLGKASSTVLAIMGTEHESRCTVLNSKCNRRRLSLSSGRSRSTTRTTTTRNPVEVNLQPAKRDKKLVGQVCSSI